MPADPRRVKNLFAAALDLADPPARQALLDRECGDDADLRRRLDALLAAHDRPDPALDRPLAGPPANGTVDQPPPSEIVGTVVAGRYKLLEEIGEGGMGTVWMAEQREPVKRLVALKLIKAGMDSRQVLARFEAERQALALMDHPNIAKVLDGGTTAEGRPYFVMELVKGLSLTVYCDDRRLSLRERLELFIPVCQAVQHAHQKGVIHRDLKPSNILVTEHDGKPVPKVIDFGLAKALNAAGALTDRTLHTAYGAVVGTPLYMAPEQVGINALDVDTRSDVYALGVILYELLTGTTPLEKRRLKEAAWDEIRRVIREEEPPRPSLRLSASNALASLAAQRQTEPAKLSRLVRGELDWIALKALEKDRNRRYESANGFAQDVQRYLADEPVLACPPSAGYRLRKFTRKHRGRILAVSLVAAAVFAGVLGTAWQMTERRRDREVSAAQARQAVRSALDQAEAALTAGRPAEVDAALNLAQSRMAEADDPDTADRLRGIATDRDMVRELEDVFEQRWTVCHNDTGRNARRAKDRYAEAFTKYGLVVDAEVPATAVDRVRRSRIAAALLAGLEEWFFLDTHRAGLGSALDRIDPDEVRTAARAAVGAGQEERIAKLAAGTDGARLSPSIAIALGNHWAVPSPDGRRILKSAWERWPDSYPITVAICVRLLHEQEAAAEMAGWCRTTIALRPSSALGHYYLSFPLDRLGDKQGGIDSLRRAVRLAPRFVSALTELGFALRNMGQVQEALAVCRQAVELDPKDVPARVGLYVSSCGAKDWVTAAEAYREAVKLIKSETGDDGECRVSYAEGYLMSNSQLGVNGRVVRGLLAAGHSSTAYHFFIELLQDRESEPHWMGSIDDEGVDFFGACAAVQVAIGRGVNAPPMQERAGIRRQALEWLSGGLKAWREDLSKDPATYRDPTHTRMSAWLAEPLLAPVRDAAALATLPPDEQAGWANFWTAVRALHADTKPLTPPPPPVK